MNNWFKEFLILLDNDKEFYYGWQSNIAMSFVDCCFQYKKKNNKRNLNKRDIHIIGNEAAKTFLNNLIRMKREE